MRRVEGGKRHRGHGVDGSDRSEWTHLGASDGLRLDGSRSVVVGGEVLSLSSWLHWSDGGNGIMINRGVRGRGNKARLEGLLGGDLRGCLRRGKLLESGKIWVSLMLV